MSLIEDSLLADKLEAVRQAEQALQQEKTAYYAVLGEWLENALLDDNNTELRALFLKHANDVENKHKDNYLKRLSDRKSVKKVAEILKVDSKVKPSSHAENLAKSNGNSEGDNNHNLRQTK